jgi:Calx-beta domain-containing protein/Big-like domain-containing protein
VTAVYSGDSRFEPATSQPMQVNIAPAHTRLEVQMATPILTGESTSITVSVAVSPASAVIPAGRVEISGPNGILDSRDLAGGAATFSIAPLPPGDHPLVVHYIGNADFESSSASVTETVLSPLLAVHSTRVNEGNHGVGTVSLIVMLSAPVSQPVRVSFATLDGTATEGEDYEKASGVIEFAPGELSRSIELHIIGDTFPEADETFSLFLSDPVNATIDIPSAAIVIVNDDQAPSRRRPSRH